MTSDNTAIPDDDVCAACGRPLGDAPVERLTTPGTEVLRAYHVACVPPTLDEQI